MACVVVTTISAIGVAVASKVAKKREDSRADSNVNVNLGANLSANSNATDSSAQIPLSRKLSWLGIMLGFGSLLLIFEHIWHGEIVPWFPFLTAMSDAEATNEMLREMVLVGGSMTILIIAVWTGMVIATNRIMRSNSASIARSANQKISRKAAKNIAQDSARSFAQK